MKKDHEPGKILVVDDDPVNLLLTCQTLSGEGFATTEAESGEAALAAFAAAPQDLVLLDVIMPGIDGFETCTRIRELPGGERVPIVIMTGLDDEASIRRAYDAGATDFITKPITWPVLGHRVRYILRSSDAMQSLSKSRASLTNAQRIAKIGSCDFDMLHNEMRCSEEIFRILEIDPGTDVISYEAFLNTVHPNDRELVDRTCRGAVLSSAPCEIEHRLLMTDSRVKWVRLRGILETAGNAATSRFMATIQDVTDRKAAEEKIHYLAYYDDLTGLPNRNMFQEQLESALAVARRGKQRLAVLMLNLDRFHRINDTFGHVVGDQLLKTISGRIRTRIRSGDYAARFSQESMEVVRWAGDEFAVIAINLSGPDNAVVVAQRLLADLNQPCPVQGEEITMTACVGISVFPEDGKSVGELVKNAQAALWHSRKTGPNSCRYYTQSMNAHAYYRLAMESSLRQALSNDQMELFYQPLVQAGTGEIAGAEALIRWRHPERGLIEPGAFIPIAEETGLIIPISEWVLAAACAQCKSWQEAGLKPIMVAVNLAAAHFQGNLLVGHVQQALSRAGLSGSRIELEVTESMLMQNLESTMGVMEDIRALGVRFTIDDFGTGYSSLSYLKRLPVHALKIDRSFICSLPDGAEDLAIVRAVVALSRSLGLTVVAEGVENASQAQLLSLEGVDLLQGYYFSRPVPAAAFTEMLTRGTTAGSPHSRETG